MHFLVVLPQAHLHDTLLWVCEMPEWKQNFTLKRYVLDWPHIYRETQHFSREKESPEAKEQVEGWNFKSD